ncbi:hypothetical protein BDW68DRAFT_17851 [Aspergillus falconensis]
MDRRTSSSTTDSDLSFSEKWEGGILGAVISFKMLCVKMLCVALIKILLRTITTVWRRNSVGCWTRKYLRGRYVPYYILRLYFAYRENSRVVA